MSGVPKYGRKDKNQSPIVDQLRDIPGVSVVTFSVEGIGDMLIGFRGVTFLIELKDGKNKLTKAQREFRAMWTGQHDVCHNIQDVLKVIGF